MTPKHFYLLLVALIAFSTTTAQNEDELQIPVENDNQFPPDNPSDIIEGSGDGVIEEPSVFKAEITEVPPIEHIETRILLEDDVDTPSEGQEEVCPKPCLCHSEGTNDFVINCSGYDLEEFPSPLNEKATILNIQKNKITEIPKSISTLKKLKILRANDNSIANLVPGSISELPELVTLELRNNRLIEYPNDLKNSFGLIKLQKLDLGGNDMRTPLTADIFSKFESLQSITLPSSTTELQQDLCNVLSKSLRNVCTGSCDQESYECPEDTYDDIPKLAGELFPWEDITGPTKKTPENEIRQKKSEQDASSSTTSKDNLPNVSGETTTTGKPFSRVAINKGPSDIALHNAPIEIAPEAAVSTEVPVKVGATTTETKTGGVDKTVIGLVVVGMVVIVAVITIKKNWSSIKKRFGSSSNSRTPNQHAGGNTNGTVPEEMPLQDKSPV